MDKVKETKQKLSDISASEYKYGFKTEIEEENTISIIKKRDDGTYAIMKPNFTKKIIQN